MMNTATRAPASESLALVVKQNSEEAPEEDQAGVRHDGWDESD